MLFKNTLSPKAEMIAFEILWAMDGMTEKKFASLFRENMRLPSEILGQQAQQSGEDFSDLEVKVEDFLSKMDKDFSIAVNSDYQYPDKLQDAAYPIEAFYYKGDINLLNRRCISVVGSRKCSEQGLLRAKKLSKLLVKEGVTIVSGLAEGVDTVALKAAIENGGRVIGVVGTPINQTYPKKNAALQEEIAENHLLISQVPFYRYQYEQFDFHRFYFPRRNVTMSAISEGTVVVEASDTSGTISQARAALKQKRKLFILNSCFENKTITWPEKFIAKGAIRVFKIEDITKNLTHDRKKD